jgi:predicted transposase/invertase (TIGR01784 family)
MGVFLKNLENFDHIPAILNEPIFQKGFEIAEVSQLTPRQYDAYLKSLVDYSEVKNVSDMAFGDGIAKGETKALRKVAKSMLAKGFELNTIAEITGLSEAKIKKLTEL